MVLKNPKQSEKLDLPKTFQTVLKTPPPPNCMVSILWKSNYTQLLIYSGAVTQNFLVVSVIRPNHPPSCHHKYILSSKWNSITSNSHPILVGFIYILDSSLAFDLVMLLLAQLVTTQMIEWLICHFAVDKSCISLLSIKTFWNFWWNNLKMNGSAGFQHVG